MTVVSKADLYAITDVANLLLQEADGIESPEQAIELAQEARKAIAVLTAAAKMLEAQALAHMESRPVLVGDAAYRKAPVIKMRPDQMLVKRVVTKVAARPDEDGVLPELDVAVAAAVDLMADMYVSPSTVPKVGGLRRMGLTLDDVCSEEHTGFELKRTEIG